MSMQSIKGGFTLVELMVTIAILAIVAMIAAPSMTSMRYNQELKDQERKISLILSDARSNSKALNKPMHVYFTAPNSSSDSSNIFYFEVDPEKFDFNMQGEKISFRNNGVLDVSSACIQLEHIKSKKVKSITLNHLGMQQLADTKCGGAV